VKVAIPTIRATSVFFNKQTKVNFSPMSECSPNLVTLVKVFHFNVPNKEKININVFFAQKNVDSALG
jgi:hypothetical protein